MAIRQLTTFLALFALGGVNASPEEDSATTLVTSARQPTATLGSDAPVATLGSSSNSICVRREKPWASLVCSGWGFSANHDGKAEYAIKRESVEACADLCNETEGCRTFSFFDGSCQMYHNTMERLGFRPSDASGAVLWYEMDCWLCENTSWLVMSDDFEDGNADDWAIISDDLDDFYFDVQEVQLYNGRKTKTFRILEAGIDEAAEFQHFKHFNLEEGETYQVTFYGKADARGKLWKEDDFHPITAVIWDANNAVLEYWPQNGLPMGDGWYRFRTTFTVGQGLSSSYVFAFVVNSSGLQMDWYFDDITVETLPL